MSSDKRKELDLLFEQGPPRELSAYDIFEGAWEIHEDRLAILEENYLDTVKIIEMNRFRSVCNTGIISTLIFGGCVSYLTNIDYIRFEVGVPVLGGIIAILTGFFVGLRRNNK